MASTRKHTYTEEDAESREGGHVGKMAQCGAGRGPKQRGSTGLLSLQHSCPKALRGFHTQDPDPGAWHSLPGLPSHPL